MAGKPLYENVGIGTIIKRIGECTALTGDYNTSIQLTQQTPREDECKDLCITVGSKIVVIDFKAPDKISSSERIYRNIQTRIGSLKNLLGSNNLMLGLLHATLRVTPQTRHINGYYLHTATPITTIFVPLSQLVEYTQKFSHTLNLGDIRIREAKHLCFSYRNILYNIMGSEKDLTLRASIPSCYNQNYLLFNKINRLYYCCSIIHEEYPPACVEAGYSDCCLSCGGLCDVILRYYDRSLRGYTLASLLWKMRCCKLGHYIENIGELADIIGSLRSIRWLMEHESEFIYILSYTPGRGFQIIPLNF